MWIMLGIVIAVIVYGAMLYNNAISGKEAVINSHKMIDVQLDARGKEIDSLINLTKAYVKHEGDVFTRLAELRSAAISAKTENNDSLRFDLESKIDELINSTKGFSLTVENYPELKANELFVKNQEAIISAEQKLMSAKRGYNFEIESLKVLLEKFPNNIFFGMFGSKFDKVLKEYQYWSLNETQRATQEEKRFDI